jgi:hypothetical protein
VAPCIKACIPAKIHRLQSCREATFRLPVHRFVSRVKLGKFAVTIEIAQQRQEQLSGRSLVCPSLGHNRQGERLSFPHGSPFYE